MTKRKQPVPLDVFSYNEIVDRFHGESDRAAAVLAGGYLDSFLEDALRSVFVSGTRVDDLFDGQGALRSFGNKISMAYALGLVPAELARDMDLIRKIRNHFAHHIWEAAFGLPPVRDWCNEIGVLDVAMSGKGEAAENTTSPRVRYLLAVGLLILLIAQSPKIPESLRERVTGIRHPKQGSSQG